MIRRIQISLRPADALVALVSLHAPAGDPSAPPGASSSSWTFGARFGAEVGRVLDGHARALDVFGQCLDWLERRGLAKVERARARNGLKPMTWLCPAELRVDVRALLREVEEEGDAVDPVAKANVWALRAVLRHLAHHTLHVGDVKVGAERASAAEALGSFDAAMGTVGYGANAAPPPRLAHLRTRRGEEPEVRVAEPKVEAPKTQPTKVTAAKVEATKTQPAKVTAAKVEATKTETAKPETAKAHGTKADSPNTATAKAEATKVARATTEAPKAEAKRAKAPPPPRSASGAGFGGLPDDAVSEDRRAGEQYSARGLTLDAEFFLTEAAIATWPCDARTLEQGRRALVSRLHPDRAGEDSTAAFHRAIKGHAELLKKLSATATSTVTEKPTEKTAAPPAPVASVTPEKPAETSVEKPADVPAAKPAKTRRPRTPREPAVAAAVTAAQSVEPAAPTAIPSTPPPPPSATGSTFEWPPRAPTPEKPTAVVTAAPAASETAARTVTRRAPRASKRAQIADGPFADVALDGPLFQPATRRTA